MPDGGLIYKEISAQQWYRKYEIFSSRLRTGSKLYAARVAAVSVNPVRAAVRVCVYVCVCVRGAVRAFVVLPWTPFGPSSVSPFTRRTHTHTLGPCGPRTNNYRHRHHRQ